MSVPIGNSSTATPAARSASLRTKKVTNVELPRVIKSPSLTNAYKDSGLISDKISTTNSNYKATSESSALVEESDSFTAAEMQKLLETMSKDGYDPFASKARDTAVKSGSGNIPSFGEFQKRRASSKGSSELATQQSSLGTEEKKISRKSSRKASTLRSEDSDDSQSSTDQSARLTLITERRERKSLVHVPPPLSSTSSNHSIPSEKRKSSIVSDRKRPSIIPVDSDSHPNSPIVNVNNERRKSSVVSDRKRPSIGPVDTDSQVLNSSKAGATRRPSNDLGLKEKSVDHQELPVKSNRRSSIMNSVLAEVSISKEDSIVAPIMAGGRRKSIIPATSPSSPLPDESSRTESKREILLKRFADKISTSASTHTSSKVISANTRKHVVTLFQTHQLAHRLTLFARRRMIGKIQTFKSSATTQALNLTQEMKQKAAVLDTKVLDTVKYF